MSSTYSFDDVELYARATADKVGSGYVYTRWANPTIDAFEAAVAALEGTEDAEAFSSGMAAISSVALALCSPGDRLVAARQLYGGSHALFTDVLPRFGIAADLFEVADHDGISGACAGAVLLYCETIGNPRIAVADLDALGEIAASYDIPMIVDNTFASPALCRPIEHGASLSIHSATKFLGGHLDLMGGVACGAAELVDRVRSLTRETGPTMSPFNAWLALRGLQTLHLRIERSSASASTIARTLRERDDINAVYHPALDDGAGGALLQRILGGRGGGTMAFEVAGGKERARRVQEALRLISPAASLGGTHSLIVHAASVTHTQLSPDELRAAGIAEGFCRLAVGVEDAEDLVADLTQALDSV